MPQTASDWITIAVGIATLIVALTALIAWFKKWLRQQVAEPVKETTQQLTTSNGKSVGNYVEEMYHTMNVLKETVQENREMAVRGLTLAEFAHTRLDQHLHETYRPDERWEGEK